MRRTTALLAVLLAGCRCGGRRDPVADAVKRDLAKQLGVKVRSVRCTRDACEATLAAGGTVHVTVHGDREVTWESDDVVIAPALEARIRDELAALGVTAPVRCGSSVPLPLAAPLRCTLGGGGAVWVRFRDDGEPVLEVALTPAVVTARTEAVDVASLDDLSRALDTDEAEGVTQEDPDDDDAAAPVDGGADGGVDGARP